MDISWHTINSHRSAEFYMIQTPASLLLSLTRPSAYPRHRILQHILRHHRHPLRQQPSQRHDVWKRRQHPILRPSTPKNIRNRLRQTLRRQPRKKEVVGRAVPLEHLGVHGVRRYTRDPDRGGVVQVAHFRPDAFVDAYWGGFAGGIVYGACEADVAHYGGDDEEVAVVALGHGGEKCFGGPEDA